MGGRKMKSQTTTSEYKEEEVAQFTSSNPERQEKLSKTEIKKIILKKIKEEIGMSIYYGPCLKNHEKFELAVIELAIPASISPAFKKMQVKIFVRIIDTGIVLNFEYSYSHFRGQNGVTAEFFHNFANRKWEQYS
jgi:hypothetical protein